MKQVFQDLSNGNTYVDDIPTPMVRAGSVLVASRVSLISIGTERMLLDFGRGSLIDKARQQPDKVKMVLDKVGTDGLLPTIEAVRAKLTQPIPMGYSNVGVVTDTGDGVQAFSPGDRVVSNGSHAGIVSVPANLCAKIPDEVSDDTAAFTVVGAIALQGIRLANPTIGELFVVTGLGLIGLMTVQLLVANGVSVIGVDFDREKLDLARKFGAHVVDLSAGEDPESAAAALSGGRGVDGVLITASSKSDDIVHQAAAMCRKRGRIVLVGVVGLNLRRSDFYEKELTFQVSCSYGPGRYDPAYEELGQDYPIGFVRWTEQRNFEAVLDLMKAGRIDVEPFINQRFPIDAAAKAYDYIAEERQALGVLLEYPDAPPDADHDTRAVSLTAAPTFTAGSPVIALVGAGNYAGRVLVPAFAKTGAVLKTIVSSGGASGVHVGKKFGFHSAATDAQSVFEDPDINAVVVATQHDTHCDYVLRALAAGKHVFVEKPLCLTLDELAHIREAASAAKVGLMVGFNRRFSPLTGKVKALLDSVSAPKSFIMTVNAGAIPADHWTQLRDVGGGRIIGEGCHFIDLLRFLAASPIEDITTQPMGEKSGSNPRDSVAISLRFADGSIGVIHYLANGNAAFAKERLEVFCGGRILQLDNFRRIRAWGWTRSAATKLWRQDKGQEQCVQSFVTAIQRGGTMPIPLAEILEVSEQSIVAQAQCD